MFTRMSPPWRWVALGTAVVLGVAVLVVVGNLVLGGSETPPARTPQAAPGPVALYVNPTGYDTNPGTEAQPLQTIQQALEKAGPGTTINLAPGIYHEQPATVRDGAPGAPITIKGPETGKDRSGRYQATVYGTGRVFTVDNNYYTLDGFTIDGQEALATTPFPAALAAVDAFKNSVQPKVEDSRLIYIGSAEDTRDLTGITISNMFLNGAGGECVRLRNNAHDNTVTESVIQYCGMFGKGGDDEKRTEFHNGEGVYIGTSPKSEDQPMADNDGSSNNVVTNNVIRTFGSECLGVKENAHDNLFEGNVCSDNTESVEFEGSNVELRGYLNTVRNNQISDSAGYNIKIASDDEDYDNSRNAVENNKLTGSSAAAMKIGSEVPQGLICANAVGGPKALDGEVSMDISAPCPAG